MRTPDQNMGAYLRKMARVHPGDAEKQKETLAQIELKKAVRNEKKEVWELTLIQQMVASGLPKPVRGFQPVPGRKFTTDIAYPDIRLLIEVDGGMWLPKGGHTSGTGHERDCIKDAEALVEGYKTIRVTPGMIDKLIALDYIKKIFYGTK